MEVSLANRLALAEALSDSVHEARAGDPIHPIVQTEFEPRPALSDADPSRGMAWEAGRAAAQARWAK